MSELLKKTFRHGNFTLAFDSHVEPGHFTVHHDGWSSGSMYEYFPQNKGVGVLQGKQIIFEEASVSGHVYLIVEIVDSDTLKVVQDHQNKMDGSLFSSI
jgi:hypothetical protein